MPSAVWDYRLETAYLVLVSYLALGLIGLGPALLLWPARRRAQEVIGLAPAVGLMLSLCAAVWFGALGVPVQSWSIPWLVGGIVVTAAVLWARRQHAVNLFEDRVELRWLIGTAILGFLLLVLPPMMGGPAFVVLRGNAWDTFNYVDMAYTLNELPLGYARSAPVEELARLTPDHVRAQPLLMTRWTTAALLAFCANVAHEPIYRCEYAYPALMFLLAVGPTFLCARLLGVGNITASLAALTMAAGFHAQVLLDMRAFSQANSLPLLLLLLLFLNNGISAAWFTRETLALALCLAALIVAYVELLPLIAGLLLVGIVLVRCTMRQGWTAWRPLWGGSLLGLLLILPDLQVMFSFFRTQAGVVVAANPPFHQYFFPWLLIHPILGICSLDYPAHLAPQIVGASLLRMLLLGFSGVLAIAVVSSLIRNVRLAGVDTSAKRYLGLFLCAGLAAGAVQCCGLLALGKTWPACKGLLFLAPLITLAIVFVCGCRGSSARRWSALSAAVALLWLTGQVGWGMIRIGMAATAVDYAHYMKDISQPSEYRQHDLSLQTIRAASTTGHCPPTIWAAIPDFLMSRYVGYALREQRLILLEGIADMDCAQVATRQPMDLAPDFLLVQRGLLARNSPLLTREVAGNQELSLLRAPEDPQTLVQIIEELQLAENRLRRAGRIQVPGNIETPVWLAEQPITGSGWYLPNVAKRPRFDEEVQEIKQRADRPGGQPAR